MTDENPLENELKCVQLAAAKLDLKLKEEEIARKPSYLVSLLAQPAVLATLVASLLTAAGGIITRISAEYNVWVEQEKTKNAELIEQLKTKDIEKIEHLKQEGELILGAIKVETPEKATRNIEFLVESGLLQDPPLEEKLKSYLKTHPPHHESATPKGPATLKQ